MPSSVVLIIIDDPEHRTLLNRFFSSTDYHLVYAMDGEDGFDRYNEVKPDLVMLYAHVKRLDGTILCQLIRQQTRGEDTPIVMMVNESSHRAPEWASSVGADAMLRVPFERARVLSTIAPLLANGRPAPPPVIPRALSEPGLSDPTDVLGAPLTPVPIPTAGPPPRSSSNEPDMDTVVSYQNPFYEGDRGAAVVDPQIGDHDVPTPRGHGVAEMTSGIGVERPTAIDDQPTADGMPIEVRTLEHAGQPATHVLEASSRAATPVDDLREAAEALAAQDRAETPVPPVLQPRSIPDERDPSGPTRAVDPLEEPRIQSSHSAPEISKSSLIQEIPREGTPSSSDDQRISAIKRRAEGKERRGLDESQLGKRLAKRVRKVYGLLEEVDYYQLLGVERDATDHALQTAYFDLSLEFHPDRFFLLRSGDLKEKIYAIYRRISEAYRVLSNDPKRAAYLEMLGGDEHKRAPEDMRAPEREKTGAERPALQVSANTTSGRPFVEAALQAYDLGDLNATRLHLFLARTLEIDNHEVAAALDRIVEQIAPTV
ncbi:MAG: DnaJ domain-containing protein [Deltaproteobacteria bacterium]